MSILYVSLDTGNDIEEAYRNLMLSVLEDGAKVDTGHWQAIRDVPHTKTLELQNVIVEVPIPPIRGAAASFFKPNLPWAEGHFQERVAGEPTNPGDWYDKWPWYKPGWEAQGGEDKFSHTYQERFWPRHAGDHSRFVPSQSEHWGVRFHYGDLADVVSLLDREPCTRQAYLPVWFPEDTGAHHEQRVPCTLGYHFMMRQDRLDCNYFIRSCDLVRYFKDDAYMAARLTQWIIDRLRDKESLLMDSNDEGNLEVNGLWHFVQPGNLFMHIPSLHVFQAEAEALRRKYA